MPNVTITVGKYRVLPFTVLNLDGSVNTTAAPVSFGPNNASAIKVEAVPPAPGEAVRSLYVSGLAPIAGGQVGVTIADANGGPAINPIIGVTILAAPVNGPTSASFGDWGPELSLPHP